VSLARLLQIPPTLPNGTSALRTTLDDRYRRDEPDSHEEAEDEHTGDTSLRFRLLSHPPHQQRPEQRRRYERSRSTENPHYHEAFPFAPPLMPVLSESNGTSALLRSAGGRPEERNDHEQKPQDEGGGDDRSNEKAHVPFPM
jgi:hypothetical protein